MSVLLAKQYIYSGCTAILAVNEACKKSQTIKSSWGWLIGMNEFNGLNDCRGPTKVTREKYVVFTGRSSYDLLILKLCKKKTKKNIHFMGLASSFICVQLFLAVQNSSFCCLIFQTGLSYHIILMYYLNYERTSFVAQTVLEFTACCFHIHRKLLITWKIRWIHFWQ